MMIFCCLSQSGPYICGEGLAQNLSWIEQANWVTTRLPGLLGYFSVYLLSHFIIALGISGHDSALHVRPCNESIRANPRPFHIPICSNASLPASSKRR